MSRIVGFISEAGDAPGLTLDAMLAAVSGSVAGQATGVAFGPAALGHWGWSGPNSARSARTMVVLDGDVVSEEPSSSKASGAALVLDLFERHGFPALLKRVSGHFAIAVYDCANGELWLARDHVGVKPLYYAHNKHGLFFASRPRALLSVPSIRNTPRPSYVALFAGSHYRVFDNDPAASPYSDIVQLPAATYLKLRDGNVSTYTYWSLREQEDLQESEGQLAERYRDHLMRAVSDRLKAGTSTAFTLSGGMDSSSVLACAVRLTGQKQKAFSSVYEDPTYDESNEIQSMLAETVSTWTPVRLATPDLFSTVHKMIRANDEPVATATWLAHYQLCQETHRAGISSLFGGLGGDELNAGEFEYFPYFFADLQASGDLDTLERETAAWIAHHDHPIFRKTRDTRIEALKRLVDFSRPGTCLPDLPRLHKYSHLVNRDFWDVDAFRPEMDHPFSSFLKNRTFHDIFRETAPCCIRAADRQCTEFGLQPVWPFYDHRLVEFMFRIKGTLKIRNGVTKYLLREAMRSVLPEETRTRVKKTGWNAPAHVWFVGAREMMLDLIGSRAFRERGIYDVPEVLRLYGEHERIVSSGAVAENHMMFFWQLLNLEVWLQQLTDDTQQKLQPQTLQGTSP